MGSHQVLLANPGLSNPQLDAAESLQRWGCEVHRGLGVTGVVGTLRAGSSTRRVNLRADMDALPTGASYWVRLAAAYLKRSD